MEYITEKLNKRDLHYNNRRRLYGAVGAVDIDMIDFDKNDNPILVSELKHALCHTVYLSECRKQINVANRLEVPCVLTIYYNLKNILTSFGEQKLAVLDADDHTPENHVQYFLYPLNKIALGLLFRDGEMITEYSYIKLLHKLRNQNPPSNFDNVFYDHLETKSSLTESPVIL